MKKFIIAAITVITLATSAFAADNNDSRVINQFKTAYPGATNVHYKTIGELVSISFVMDSTNMQAFYNEGELVATSRTISYQQLPLRAITTLQSKYNGYTTTEVIELDHNTEGSSYYVSLETNNQKVVVKVTTSGDVSVFKKSTK
ncbi:hypothetical protein SAMN05421788_10567 [Filimonas lacunae]|uniref:Beta-lactamase-inhibitor-like, PepSY-like n=1 Tax=Filimonas lacunae TaxID=477680 RepID=A0A173MD84_9BACT|nr:hypothetical protein [Filimonas lacunae]BAV05480.1 hypothetical protein FLA_1487 [Filimonas lacunae]SIT20827.1 hypothetical protein SAMN05421788_10567 [Filimonas lacunae]